MYLMYIEIYFFVPDLIQIKIQKNKPGNTRCSPDVGTMAVQRRQVKKEEEEEESLFNRKYMVWETSIKTTYGRCVKEKM